LREANPLPTVTISIKARWLWPAVVGDVAPSFPDTIPKAFLMDERYGIPLPFDSRNDRVLPVLGRARTVGEVTDVILLDLNLPRKGGREVLKEIKADAELGLIPVVILTNSQEKEDLCRTYRLHTNCYVTKPVELAQFIAIVRSIESFWFTIVKLPSPQPVSRSLR
jgi:CheY-like chemotaxis protein